MKYKGWIIDLSEDPRPYRFSARDPNGDYPMKFGDSVDALIEEVDEEIKEYFGKSELLSAKDDVVEAARCIRHWHDSSDGEMTVSGHHVRCLLSALAKLDELQRREVKK